MEAAWVACKVQQPTTQSYSRKAIIIIKQRKNKVKKQKNIKCGCGAAFWAPGEGSTPFRSSARNGRKLERKGAAPVAGQAVKHLGMAQELFAPRCLAFWKGHSLQAGAGGGWWVPDHNWQEGRGSNLINNKKTWLLRIEVAAAPFLSARTASFKCGIRMQKAGSGCGASLFPLYSDI